MLESARYVALLLKDGVYECGSVLKEELNFYSKMLKQSQGSVDRARELNPDWTDAQTQQYADGLEFTSLMNQAKDCVTSPPHSYPAENLDPLVIPELSIPGLATGIGIAIGLSVLAYMKYKNRSPNGLDYNFNRL